MLAADLRIRVFDPQTASTTEWEALNRFRNALQRERHPDDPPETLAITRSWLLDVPAFIEAHVWTIPDPGGTEIVASGHLTIWHAAENQHLGDARVGVVPTWRRQGLARRLLAPIGAEAERLGRTTLFGGTYDRCPAGAAFMTRLGGRLGLESRGSQLATATVDRALLRRWQERAAERAPDFALAIIEGPFPEDQLAAFAGLMDAMNHAPRGDLEFEDEHTTPEQLREGEDSMRKRGHERWTAYVRKRATGELAGFTMLVYDPERPQLMFQWGTAVWPHQGNRPQSAPTGGGRR